MVEQTTEFTFVCPHCGQHLSAELDLVDIEMECPACGEALTVPRPNSTEQNQNVLEELHQAQFGDSLENQQKNYRGKIQHSVPIPSINESPQKSQYRPRKKVLTTAIIVLAIVGLLNAGILGIGVYFWSRHVKEQEATRRAEQEAMRRAEQAAAERSERVARERKQAEVAAQLINLLISAENASQQQIGLQNDNNSWLKDYNEEQKRRQQIYEDERIRQRAREGKGWTW